MRSGVGSKCCLGPVVNGFVKPIARKGLGTENPSSRQIYTSSLKLLQSNYQVLTNSSQNLRNHWFWIKIIFLTKLVNKMETPIRKNFAGIPESSTPMESKHWKLILWAQNLHHFRQLLKIIDFVNICCYDHSKR